MSLTDHSIDRILGLESEQPRKRQRRNRTIFSDDTIALLENSFAENKYPDIKKRIQLAKQIGEEEARVQVWFQNRRARQRRSRKRPRANSDGASSTSSSPSPPPTASLKSTWLQIKEQYSTYRQYSDGILNNTSHESVYQDGTCDTASPPFNNSATYPPELVSPLPNTPVSQQKHQRTQFSLWTPLTSSPPNAISPQPLAVTNNNILRLPLSNKQSPSSMIDLSQSEVRSADGKVFLTM